MADHKFQPATQIVKPGEARLPVTCEKCGETRDKH